MSCETNQTSPILDCICINGKTLIEYIDAGDQTLQALILKLQQTIAALQQCCTTNSADLAAFQAAIAAIQAILTTLQSQIHPPLTLTKTQNVTNRATLVNQVLNLPPPLVSRIWSTSLNQILTSGGQIQQITGLVQDFDTWSGLAAGTAKNSITIPRTGRYNITAGWGTQAAAVGAASTNTIAFVTGQATLGATIGINGAWAGRFTNPSSPYLAESVNGFIPAHLLQAGDIITLGAYIDVPDLAVTTAYLAVAYIEGT